MSDEEAKPSGPAKSGILLDREGRPIETGPYVGPQGARARKQSRPDERMRSYVFTIGREGTADVRARYLKMGLGGRLALAVLAPVLILAGIAIFLAFLVGVAALSTLGRILRALGLARF